MMGRRFPLGTLLLAVIGLTLAIAPQVWAPEPLPGDLDTKECRDVQIAAQAAIPGDPTNHGQVVRAAANVVSPFVEEGAISEECSSCIIHQIARRVPIEEQEPCGPDRVCGDGEIDPGEECDDGNNAGGDGCNASCQCEGTCGDGQLNPCPGCGEECDAGAVCIGTPATFPCPATPGPGSLFTCDITDGSVPNLGGIGCSTACGGAALCLWLGFPTDPTSGCRVDGSGLSPVAGTVCNSIQCGDGDPNDPGEDCDPGPGAVDATDPIGNPAVCVDTVDGLLDGVPCTSDGATAIPCVGCVLGSCSIDHSNDAISNTASCDVDCTDVVCGDGLVNTLAGEQCDDRGECPDTTPCTVGDPSGPTNTCGDPLDCAPAGGDGCSASCGIE